MGEGDATQGPQRTTLTLRGRVAVVLLLVAFFVAAYWLLASGTAGNLGAQLGRLWAETFLRTP